VDILEDFLKNLFACQKLLEQATINMPTDTSDAALITARAAAATLAQFSVVQLEGFEINLINLYHNFKSLEVATICRSNKYFVEYGANYLMENLS